MLCETIWEKKGVYQRYSGQVSNNDRENAKIAVLEDARFDTINYWIVDSLEIKEYLLNTIDAEDAAACDIGAANTNNMILMAFVTTNADHRTNILRFMKILVDVQCPWKIKLFEDIESARQWIAKTL